MDFEARHQLQEMIGFKVHVLVNALTEDLSPEDDDEIRQNLTDTFRFWRTI